MNDAEIIACTESILRRYTHRVGFSGSRQTPYGEARRIIIDDIDMLPLDTCVITGGCVGVDAVVAEFAHKRGLYVVTILPGNTRLVDPLHMQHAKWVEALDRSYKERNARIVHLSNKLNSYPAHAERDNRSTRSGTWQTIRMARDAHRNAPLVRLLDTYA